MSTLRNRAPGFIYNGFNDQSIEELLPDPIQVPIHYPLVYLMTQKGPLVPQGCSGNDALRLYGRETFNVRSEYYTHQTALAEAVMGRGNRTMIKRLEPWTDDLAVEESATASVYICAEIDSGVDMVAYERDTNGKYVRDTNGALVPVAPAATIAGGVVLKWVAKPASEIADPTTTYVAGTVTGYPCFEIKASSYGAWGNLVGLNLFTPRDETGYAIDLDIVKDQKAMIHSGSVWLKENTLATAAIQKTLLGQTEVNYALVDGIYDPSTNVDLKITRLVDDFNDDGIISGLSPQFGSLGSVAILPQLSVLLGVLKVAEEANLPTDGDFPDSVWEDATAGYETGWSTTIEAAIIGLFDGKDKYGIDHFGFILDTTSAGVINLVPGEKIWLMEGADGDMDLPTYNLRVENEVLLYNELDGRELLNYNRFPFSCVYDTGFEMTTKNALTSWIAMREDVHVAISTFVHGDDPLTPAEEYTTGSTLKASMLTYGGAESDVFGTPTTRAVLMAQSGIPLVGNYKQRMPMTFELAMKRADYMGAGEGVVRSSRKYNNYPNNTVQFMKDVSSTYLSLSLKNQVWSAGINYCEFSDTRQLFYPVIQTIYNFKNSVLIGEMFMAICVDITKRSGRVWAKLSGRDDLTEAQFIEESNRVFLQEIAGAYGDNVTVVPNTYFTPADSARGYTWVQDVEVFGNVPKTVGQVNIITRRLT